eukprot:m.116961 g.116961  ORF g.116961 m.116961 type:complete len:1015 (-) comp28547_c0_seq3:87-3131(-)
MYFGFEIPQASSSNSDDNSSGNVGSTVAEEGGFGFGISDSTSQGLRVSTRYDSVRGHRTRKFLELHITDLKLDSAADCNLKLHRLLGLRWCLDESVKSCKIGRNEANCEIAIASDRTLSSEHAEICFEAGEFVIRDQGSSNGTTVESPSRSVFEENGVEITRLCGANTGESTALKTGSKITCGVATFTITVHTTIEGATQLHAAIKDQNVAEVRELLCQEEVTGMGRWLNGKSTYTVGANSYTLTHQEEHTQIERGRACYRLPLLSYPLHTAVATGDTDIVECLLKSRADVNMVMVPELLTPLHVAVQASNLDTLQMLLRNGADVSLVDGNGATACDLASEYDYSIVNLLTSCIRLGSLAASGDLPAIIQLVQQESVPINARCHHGRTPLVIAATRGRVEVVEWLIKHDADINIGASLGLTDFDISQAEPGAIQKDHWKNIYGNTALHEACRNNHATVASTLITASADVHCHNHAGLTPLEMTRTELMKDIVWGVDESPRWLSGACGELEDDYRNEIPATWPSQTWWSPSGFHALHLAVDNLHVSAVDALAKAFNGGCNLTHKLTGITPLHRAALSGNRDVIWALVSNGADSEQQDQNKNTPLDLIDQRLKEIREQKNYLSQLSRFRGFKNLSDWEKIIQGFESAKTLLVRPIRRLLLAMEDNDVATVLSLIESDEVPANTELQGSPGTILHWAVRGTYAELMRVLIEKGAEVNMADEAHDLRTPLHEVAINGNLACAEVLINNNADLDCREASLQTPLHLAAIAGHSEMVHLFLRHDANRHLRDISSNNPFDVADTVDLQYDLAEGQELLGLAVMNEEVETITTLIHEGICDVNRPCIQTKYAIHIAARTNSVMCTRVLLTVNADINAIGGSYNFTPLHYAAFQGYVELAQFLISRNADRSIRDIDGNTAYELAETSTLKAVLSQPPSHRHEVVNPVNPFVDTGADDEDDDDTVIDVGASTETELCKICLQSKIDIVLVPCGHQAFCFSCAMQIQECAICRQNIKEVVRVYRA